jgi:hypothetical protein
MSAMALLHPVTELALGQLVLPNCAAFPWMIGFGCSSIRLGFDDTKDADANTRFRIL